MVNHILIGLGSTGRRVLEAFQEDINPGFPVGLLQIDSFDQLEEQVYHQRLKDLRWKLVLETRMSITHIHIIAGLGEEFGSAAIIDAVTRARRMPEFEKASRPGGHGGEQAENSIVAYLGIPSSPNAYTLAALPKLNALLLGKEGWQANGAVVFSEKDPLADATKVADYICALLNLPDDNASESFRRENDLTRLLDPVEFNETGENAGVPCRAKNIGTVGIQRFSIPEETTLECWELTSEHLLLNLPILPEDEGKWTTIDHFWEESVPVFLVDALENDNPVGRLDSLCNKALESDYRGQGVKAFYERQRARIPQMAQWVCKQFWDYLMSRYLTGDFTQKQVMEQLAALEARPQVQIRNIQQMMDSTPDSLEKERFQKAEAYVNAGYLKRKLKGKKLLQEYADIWIQTGKYRTYIEAGAFAEELHNAIQDQLQVLRSRMMQLPDIPELAKTLLEPCAPMVSFNLAEVYHPLPFNLPIELGHNLLRKSILVLFPHVGPYSKLKDQINAVSLAPTRLNISYTDKLRGEIIVLHWVYDFPFRCLQI